MSKYIRFGDDLVLAISPTQTHSHFKEAFGQYCKPVSAGMIRIANSFQNEVACICYDESVTLKLKSGETDSDFVIDCLKKKEAHFGIYDDNNAVVIFGSMTEDPLKKRNLLKSLFYSELFVFGKVHYVASSDEQFECDTVVDEFYFTHKRNGTYTDIHIPSEYDTWEKAVKVEFKEKFPQFFNDSGISKKDIGKYIEFYTGINRQPW